MGSILDVVIAVAVVFAMFALLVSGLQEAWATLINRRGRSLVKALEKLLGDEAHNLLTGNDLLAPYQKSKTWWRKEKSRWPSYIPSWLFAAVVLPDSVLEAIPEAPSTADDNSTAEDKVAPPKSEADVVAALKAAVLTIDPKKGPTPADATSMAKVITALAQEVGTDRAKLETAVASWYDEYMQRVSGWYTRHTRWLLFGIALVVAVGANVDAISLTRNVWDNPTTRATLVATGSTINDCQTGDPTKTAACGSTDVSALPTADLDLFWSVPCPPEKVGEAPLVKCDFWIRHHTETGAQRFWKVIGLILGAFALSLGAPFWFDLIGRGMALRGSGPSPQTNSPTNPVLGVLAASDASTSGNGGSDSG